MSSSSKQALIRIQLWDLPTRLFHWLLAITVITAIVTGQIGGNLIQLHGQAGLATVGLLTFRLIWGFVGSSYARFINFFPTPARIKAYFQGRWQNHGHNPLGALSVFALLTLIALQVGSGLFANDDISFTGPLYPLVEEATSFRLTGFHKLLSNVLLGLLLLHIAAIVFHLRVKKDNLVKPMITGWKEVSTGESARQSRSIAFAIALLAAISTVYLASGALVHEPPPAAKTSAPAPSW